MVNEDVQHILLSISQLSAKDLRRKSCARINSVESPSLQS